MARWVISQRWAVVVSGLNNVPDIANRSVSLLGINNEMAGYVFHIYLIFSWIKIKVPLSSSKPSICIIENTKNATAINRLTQSGFYHQNLDGLTKSTTKVENSVTATSSYTKEIHTTILEFNADLQFIPLVLTRPKVVSVYQHQLQSHHRQQ